MDEVEKKISELPPEWGLTVQNYIKKVHENGRKQGIQEALEVLTNLHGKALAKHNYYAHAAIEIRKLRKK